MDGVPANREIGEALAGIALRAAGVIMDIYSGTFEVGAKSDSSPVTEADRLAEAIIVEDIARLWGDVPVIAEEAASEGRLPPPSDRFFLVDPLDGTREFIARNGEFTVNVALVEHGAPVAGVVLAPALGLLSVADPSGAREASCPGLRAPLDGDWTPLRARPPGPEGIVAVASRSHRDPDTEVFLGKLGVGNVRSAGSSLKFCLLARGEAHVYPRFGRTMEWDTAAGDAILRAAGGTVLTADGHALVYGKRDAGYANPPFIAWSFPPGEARERAAAQPHSG